MHLILRYRIREKINFLGSDNTDSVVDIWQTKPISFPDGTIKLSGGIIKSFKGKSGLLVKLSFKVLTPGEVEIFLEKSDVYIADGKGTKLPTNTKSLTVSVKESGEVVTSPVPSFQNTPTDILIEQELEKLKKADSKPLNTKSMLIFVLIFFVICVWWVYNRFRRKL